MKRLPSKLTEPPMTIVQSENVVCFDVDDTLILWDKGSEADCLVNVRDPHTGENMTLRIHVPHVQLLKKHKARGKFIIVWSQSGYAWGEAVVNALELQPYVNLIMSKPRSYVDDLPAEAWLKDRIYISPESNWGSGLGDTE